MRFVWRLRRITPVTSAIVGIWFGNSYRWFFHLPILITVAYDHD